MASSVSPSASGFRRTLVRLKLLLGLAVALRGKILEQFQTNSREVEASRIHPTSIG